ncbi:MAG: hypothetical protein EPO10_14580 [Reyranella sp.]|uniref:hypothetical protein n=1 Tax=Reyranella sp. TaxID=1929291 RepID=UPI00120E3C2A|nr:hypothetical protein [Reyranella sp.]TAJ95332.1 MAG: hypothetical protein EPO41_08840 [Reyranella sp.]TBR28131.1 MAG: hypothetical protein EPO10_14580 [Reyranella sp.]
MDEPRPHPEPEAAKPTPHERVQKLRLGVRIVWWNAVALAIVFAARALWLGFVKNDLFGLFYLALAVCCAVAGYGTLLVVRRPSAS